MNKSLFKQLCMNYNKEADKELYELWEYNLRLYDEKEIQKAINIIISNDKYFPNLNRMLEVVKEVVKNDKVIYDKEYKVNRMKKLNIIPEWYNKKIKENKIIVDNNFKNFIEEFRR